MVSSKEIFDIVTETTKLKMFSANSANAANPMAPQSFPACESLLIHANLDVPAVPESLRLAAISSDQHSINPDQTSTLAELAGLAVNDPLKSLKDWLALVQQVNTREEIFALLDRFRPLSWTDTERATMSVAYIRHLYAIDSSSPDY